MDLKLLTFFDLYDGAIIILHKPHPRKELLSYQVKQIIETLSEEGFI